MSEFWRGVAWTLLIECGVLFVVGIVVLTLGFSGKFWRM